MSAATNMRYEKCAPLGYYAASSGILLPTFRDIFMGQLRIGCSETLVRNYHYLLRNNAEKCSLICFAAEASNYA
jgi:hypothetical protein